MNTLVQQCDKAVLEDAVVAMGWFLQLRRDGGDTLAEGQTIEIAGTSKTLGGLYL